MRSTARQLPNLLATARADGRVRRSRDGFDADGTCTRRGESGDHHDDWQPRSRWAGLHVRAPFMVPDVLSPATGSVQRDPADAMDNDCW